MELKILVVLLNRVKEEKKLPNLANLANITTLYKGKGEKSNLENEHGIFVLTVLRMIIDKCIYLEEYDLIDKNMSDSNAGARKDRNCRNHSFIVNGILHDKIENKGKPIELQIYDVKKCFGEVWPTDSTNVLFDLGVQNENLCILYDLSWAHVRSDRSKTSL